MILYIDHTMCETSTNAMFDLFIDMFNTSIIFFYAYLYALILLDSVAKAKEPYTIAHVSLC